MRFNLGAKPRLSRGLRRNRPGALEEKSAILRLRKDLAFWNEISYFVHPDPSMVGAVDHKTKAGIDRQNNGIASN